jgi:hypothetical protein
MAVDPLPTAHPSGEMWANIGHPVSPTSWRLPWEHLEIFLMITACVGIIPARTDIMRRSAGQIIRDGGAAILPLRHRTRPSLCVDRLAKQ